MNKLFDNAGDASLIANNLEKIDGLDRLAKLTGDNLTSNIKIIEEYLKGNVTRNGVPIEWDIRRGTHFRRGVTDLGSEIQIETRLGSNNGRFVTVFSKDGTSWEILKAFKYNPQPDFYSSRLILDQYDYVKLYNDIGSIDNLESIKLTDVINKDALELFESGKSLDNSEIVNMVRRITDDLGREIDNVQVGNRVDEVIFDDDTGKLLSEWCIDEVVINLK